ncbi:MAG: hypothetical protein A2519_02535 [Candidatus Raymondbacteria bacterium RIFOXYD12_FULL_49_13]|uniref:Uncharacterized protein n=1 Tax=Candidatus Raymondbacteria bacterium RIFOXYD12_FULL_49_13 TaxID=1817890 RepID=A0A1F7FAJ1_UNCRA|nr:MAG: hypothetical protein A2519_02535 [Candidatus Raymondbacteria bacterium RIFOXYD12_FULL_49_13]
MRFSFFIIALSCASIFAQPKDLPDKIIFKEKPSTYNSIYDFALDGRTVWLRKRGPEAGPWTVCPLPKRLSCPREIHVDSDIFIALDSTGAIYTMFNALADPDKFNWTKHWGAPFRMAKGMAIPAEYEKRALSFLSPVEDQYYHAFTGGRYDVGMGVTNIYMLTGNGQHIIYLDPWLPNDFSYEVGGPFKGRFIATAISATGSTIFLINTYGDMYTRPCDFDMVGGDDFFFNYSYHPADYKIADTLHVVPRKIPRPLPLEDWTHQPKINGTITDRITIVKSGPGTARRTLLVEGMNMEAKAGYFSKEMLGDTWSFTETSCPLKGTPLQNPPEDCSHLTLGPDESLRFEYHDADMRVTIPDFVLHVSPASLTIAFTGCRELPLLFHTHETIRQMKRESGLSDKPLELKGAIEIAPDLLVNRNALEPKVRDFIKNNFKKSNFADITVKATAQQLKISGQGTIAWRLQAKP